MQARYEALEATVAQLQRQIAATRKDSSNSSKPPSSDIVKPKAPPSGRRRKRGGQPGHTAHQRVPYPPEMLVAPLVIHEHRSHPGYCPCCVSARRFEVGRWARRCGV